MSFALVFSALHRHFPGLLAAVTVGVAASFLSDHYGGPTMLYALLLGMAFNFLSQEGRCVDGIAAASRPLLRLGVALLGMRITLGQVVAAGPQMPVMMVAAVAGTVAVALLLGYLLRQDRHFAVLTGCAVAICGASAALAVAAMQPARPGAERDTLFTVIGVTALSTVAMVVYPLLVRLFGLDPVQAGIFLGGTIHDVAQVVGAGYSLSAQTGDTAVFVKLFRVALLLPVALAVGLVSGGGADAQGRRPPLLPPFLLGFVALLALNSLGVVPASAAEAVNQMSRWCLVTAIAALGMKTSLRSLAALGPRPVLLLVGETVALAALVLAMVMLAR